MMRKRRTVICALLVLAMALTLCACGGSGDEARDVETGIPTDTDVGESAAPIESGGKTTPLDLTGGRQDLIVLDQKEYENRPHEIQPGTVFNYCTWDYCYSFNPWLRQSSDWLWGNIYEGLLYMYMNDPEDIRGCIAERWAHSDDYLTWTFQIRDGIKFTDGTVCDAEAIVKCWEYEYGLGLFAEDYNIESWEAAGPLELVVRLSAPCAWFETAVCGNPFYVLSPTALALYSRDNPKVAAGTGPYHIELYDAPNSESRENGDYGSLVLKANPDYYLDERTPNIETVNIYYLRGQENTMEALLNGDIDGAVFDDMDVYHTLRESDVSVRLAVALGATNPIWFNSEYELSLSLPEVREALCRFIDFDAINADIFDGLGAVSDSIWAIGSSGYVPTDQYYYDPDEGNALLTSVGLAAEDIEFGVSFFDDPIIHDLVSIKNPLKAIIKALDKAGIQVSGGVGDPNLLSSWPLRTGWWSVYAGDLEYRNTAPYASWLCAMGNYPGIATPWWENIFEADHCDKIYNEYNAMTAAVTWDEMLAHCRQITATVQDGLGAIGGLQRPEFIALGKGFKNGVYFSEEHWLQFYYLYQ